MRKKIVPLILKINLMGIIINIKTVLSVIFGVGLILFFMHGEHLRVNVLGISVFWPVVGALLMGFTGIITLFKYGLNPGPRVIWIPLLIISVFIAVRGIVTWSPNSLIFSIFGLLLLLYYLTSTHLNKWLFLPLLVFSIIISISCVYYSVWGLFLRGHESGGILSKYGYTEPAVLMLMSGILSFYLFRIRIAVFINCIIAVGVVFSGSPLILVAYPVMIGLFIIRRDCKPIASLILFTIVISLIVLAVTSEKDLNNKRINHLLKDTSQGKIVTPTKDYVVSQKNNGWGSGRFPAYERALKETSFLGHGYTLYRTNRGDLIAPHDVPLIILDQIGIIPMLCWLFISGYMLFRYNWLYAWVCLLTLCMFDFIIWTMLAPLWWVMIGITSTTFRPGNNLLKVGGDIEKQSA